MRVRKRLANQIKRRRFRVRNRIVRDAHGRPRLSVFRSNSHIYAQVIDDVAGVTICSASTLESDVSGPGSKASNVAFAQRVGKLIAERAVAKGVSAVVFDRGSFKYHGRVAALADAAREAGLSF